MLSNSEEHREVFPEPPVTAFRRFKNLKGLLVRARLATTVMKGVVLVVKSPDVKCVNLLKVIVSIPTQLERSIRLTFRLTVIRRVLCICLTVLCVVFSMLVALSRLLGSGLIIIRRVIVGLGVGLQFPRWTFSDIFLKKNIMGSWKTFVSL